MEQPRRYKVRYLADVEKLEQKEIAERLGVNQATVSRDLANTVPPAGFTERGTPYYPPGRFDRDAEYLGRVNELAHSMPRMLARAEAAREMDPPPPPTDRIIRSEAAKQKLLAQFERGKEAFGA